MFHFILPIALTIFQRLVERRLRSGKPNRALHSAFDPKVRQTVVDFIELYTAAAAEYDELVEEGEDL